MGEPSRIRVLLVEDEKHVGDQIAEHMSAEFDVDRAADGDEALRRLCDSVHYDACIMNWMLPLRSGDEVCRRVAESSPELLKRMILLTGKYYRGADPGWPVARLMKPVTPSLLCLLVRRIVEGRTAAEAAAELL